MRTTALLCGDDSDDDPEPAGEVGVGLALAEMGDDQQRRGARVQAPPSGAALGAAVA
jgi:hypothetical protein